MSAQKCNVEVFSRVTGFFRPVQSWNKGKVAEFSDRKKFDVDRKEIENKDGNCRVAEPLAG
ncbi:MAG: anaerobic ribonucleoside-triphosphate reductase [Candidatus Tantalella remota]|nr:anaerobic ribonucleoside-triphosphate reductase [Candidatus Tantalella remota]